jgi:hypothetical protein
LAFLVAILSKLLADLTSGTMTRTFCPAVVDALNFPAFIFGNFYKLWIIQLGTGRKVSAPTQAERHTANKIYWKNLD